MDRKLKIAVIFGGCSPEYPVSLESAHSVITSLDRSKYELILLGITKGGEWFRFYGDAAALEDDSWQSDRSKCVPAVISPDRDLHGIVEFRMNGVRTTGLSRASASWQAYPLSAAVPLPPPSAWIRTELTSWPRSQAWTCRSPSAFPGSRQRTSCRN